MPLTLEEMATKGYNKLTRKAATMSANWEAAKSHMKDAYGALPFGPNTKAAYNAGIDAGKHRTDPDKWKRNWIRGVSR
jgi:phage-related tail protein